MGVFEVSASQWRRFQTSTRRLALVLDTQMLNSTAVVQALSAAHQCIQVDCQNASLVAKLAEIDVFQSKCLLEPASRMVRSGVGFHYLSRIPATSEHA
jgi:hypothetical protein